MKVFITPLVKAKAKPEKRRERRQEEQHSDRHGQVETSLDLRRAAFAIKHGDYLNRHKEKEKRSGSRKDAEAAYHRAGSGQSIDTDRQSDRHRKDAEGLNRAGSGHSIKTDRSEAQASHQSSHRRQPSESQFAPGDVVVLHGLKDTPQFNGQYATLFTFDKSRERWTAGLSNGFRLALKLENFSPVSSEIAKELLNATRWEASGSQPFRGSSSQSVPKGDEPVRHSSTASMDIHESLTKSVDAVYDSQQSQQSCHSRQAEDAPRAETNGHQADTNGHQVSPNIAVPNKEADAAVVRSGTSSSVGLEGRLPQAAYDGLASDAIPAPQLPREHSSRSVGSHATERSLLERTIPRLPHELQEWTPTAQLTPRTSQLTPRPVDVPALPIQSVLMIESPKLDQPLLEEHVQESARTEADVAPDTRYEVYEPVRLPPETPGEVYEPVCSQPDTHSSSAVAPEPRSEVIPVRPALDARSPYTSEIPELAPPAQDTHSEMAPEPRSEGASAREPVSEVIPVRFAPEPSYEVYEVQRQMSPCHSEASQARSDRSFDEEEGQRQLEAESSMVSVYAEPNDIAGLKELCFQWIHTLVVVLPFALGDWKFSPATVFFLNLVGLVPLSQLLADATDQVGVGLRSEVLGALLNATLGNATEMIVTVTSLRAGLYDVVKGAMLGSILSNLLAVLGVTIMAGAFKYSRVSFFVEEPLFNVSLLLLASMSFALPTLFFQIHHVAEDKSLAISRAVAIISGITYAAYVGVQMFASGFDGSDEDQEAMVPLVRLPTAFAVLAVATYLIGMVSDALVDSISGLIATTPMSAQFVGVILLPLAGNVQGGLQGISLARREATNIAIALAMSGCTQVALLVLPFAVIVGWIINKPMDLNFNVLEVFVMILSTLVALSIVIGGRAGWLHGLLLVSTYCTLTILFWCM